MDEDGSLGSCVVRNQGLVVHGSPGDETLLLRDAHHQLDRVTRHLEHLRRGEVLTDDDRADDLPAERLRRSRIGKVYQQATVGLIGDGKARTTAVAHVRIQSAGLELGDGR
ncbi:hypothetical protein EEB14_27990 [Rhodococcus sp. WS4]|nr:hypothetical protein EEB14_27990 [Rhodococcus sp. WS4]